MSSDELLPHARAFVAGHIRSAGDLQLLLLLAQDDTRWWDAPAVALEFGVTEAAARQGLDYLASRNLLDIRITAEVRYRFRPGTDALRAAARALLDCYRRDPLRLLQLVPGRDGRSIRDFADAFRIRRDG